VVGGILSIALITKLPDFRLKSVEAYRTADGHVIAINRREDLIYKDLVNQGQGYKEGDLDKVQGPVFERTIVDDDYPGYLSIGHIRRSSPEGKMWQAKFDSTKAEAGWTEESK
jgi:hypothetical protein